MRVESYLFFEGRCEEALQFYGRALGAKVEVLMKFKDNPEAALPGNLPPGSENKVMHASFKIGETTLLASDGHCAGKPNFQGFGLLLPAVNEAEANRWFAALSEGGRVLMAQVKTFYSPRFGMVADKFGVKWMVLVAH